MHWCLTCKNRSKNYLLCGGTLSITRSLIRSLAPSLTHSLNNQHILNNLSIINFHLLFILLLVIIFSIAHPLACSARSFTRSLCSLCSLACSARSLCSYARSARSLVCNTFDVNNFDCDPLLQLVNICVFILPFLDIISIGTRFTPDPNNVQRYL